MSRSYECGQFERNYKAVRLCNWEVPAERARPLKPTSSKPPAKTEFIASDNGHLLGRSSMLKAPPHLAAPQRGSCNPSAPGDSGRLGNPRGGRGRPTARSSQPPPQAAGPTAFDHAGRKVSASFVTGYDAMQTNRWPDNRIESNSTYGGGATMGYR